MLNKIEATHATQAHDEETLPKAIPVKAKFRNTIKMTPKQWAAVQDCPRQRDTERHAAKAIRYLRNKSPTHARVVMAVLSRNDARYKVDGHTRSHLWQEGELQAPDELLVDVYTVPDLDTLGLLYDCFDNRWAAEDSVDRLSGALRENNVTLTSSLLKRARWTSAVKYAANMWTTVSNIQSELSINVAMKEWAPFVAMVDAWNLRDAHRFTAPVLAAAFLTARRDGHEAHQFWTRYDRGLGQRAEGRMDGVQALIERIEYGRGRSKRSAESRQDELCAALQGYENWWKGTANSAALRAMSVENARKWCAAVSPRKRQRPPRASEVGLKTATALASFELETTTMGEA